MGASIRFCGAAETVTGSRHLFTVDGKRFLVDCGLFQGPREIRERNWQPFPVQPHEIDALVVTHAHMDHIGNIPRLVAQGYRGPIHATSATIALARISLPDAGRLQEEEAHYRNKKGLSRHKPALPLYSEKQAYECLKQFEKAPYRQLRKLPGGVTWQFLPAGHILGSTFAEIYFPNGEKVLMSGDLGRYNTPLIVDPTAIEFAEYLVVESTYGDRSHSTENAEEKLSGILNDAVQNGSCVLVPSFAIGRTQELLYYVNRLRSKGRIPRIPIFVDSPMASSVSQVYLQHKEEHDLEMTEGMQNQGHPMEPEGLVWVRDREQSKELNSRRGPMMVISGSGMATGGRIVHHLLTRLADPSTIVVFTGFQATGTLGRKLIEKEPEVSIFGRQVPVRARIEKLNSLSAHADQGELMTWLSGFKKPPKRTFIVHGEPPAQAALKERIEKDLGWNCAVPKHLESFEL